MKTIQIDQDIYDYLVSNAIDIGEPASRILRRELHLPNLPNKKEIDVDDDVYGYLVSKAVDLGESASDILRRELQLESPPDHEHEERPRTVEFRIPADTGTNPWNTREQAVVATVGDTLRIVNDDSVPHRLHTNGIPFPHPPTALPPGSQKTSCCKRRSILERIKPFTTTTVDRLPRSGSSSARSRERTQMEVDDIISYHDVVTGERRPLACWFSAATRNELVARIISRL